MNALGGTFTGMADVPEFKRFKVNGRIEGVSIGTVTQVTGLKPIPYGGASRARLKSQARSARKI